MTILLGIGPAWAQCVDLPSSELSVGILIPAMRVEVMSPSVRQGPERLRRAQADRAHPALTMNVVVTGQALIDRTVVMRDGRYCAAPRELEIRLGLTERVVRLPASANRSSCVKDALLAHAKQHEDTEKRIIQDFVAGTRERFFLKLEALKKVPASTSDEAYSQFREGVEELVAATVADLRAVRLREIEAVEARADHSSLAHACAGALHDIIWPRRRRA